jgi:hypothetical protein
MKTPDAGGVYRTSSEALTTTVDEREKLGGEAPLRSSAAKSATNLIQKTN